MNRVWSWLQIATANAGWSTWNNWQPYLEVPQHKTFDKAKVFLFHDDEPIAIFVLSETNHWDDLKTQRKETIQEWKMIRPSWSKHKRKSSWLIFFLLFYLAAKLNHWVRKTVAHIERSISRIADHGSGRHWRPSCQKQLAAKQKTAPTRLMKLIL